MRVQFPQQRKAVAVRTRVPDVSVWTLTFQQPCMDSTLMIVSGFARPEFVVEVEAIAAREGEPARREP